MKRKLTTIHLFPNSKSKGYRLTILEENKLLSVKSFYGIRSTGEMIRTLIKEEYLDYISKVGKTDFYGYKE